MGRRGPNNRASEFPKKPGFSPGPSFAMIQVTEHKMENDDALGFAVWGLFFFVISLIGIWKRRCPKCGKFFTGKVIHSKRKNKVSSRGTRYYIQWTRRQCTKCGYLWVNKDVGSDDERY